MAFLEINSVRIAGIAACVPAHVEDNLTIPVFREGEAERVISQTGIRQKHTVVDNTMLASDMALAAAEKLIHDLQWDKSTIDALCFVSLSHDYPEPPTACILQDRLGLPENCMTIDINQGCSGWVNGLSVLSTLVSTGNIKRALLLNGDTSSLLCSPYDKESRPLFGDGSAATAIEYQQDAKEIYFNFGTRGKDFASILTKHGGLRYPITEDSLKYKEYGENIIRCDKHSTMDGMNVFAFGMSTAPKSVTALCEKYGIDIDAIDYFIMHQANMYMNEKIRKKLKIPTEKTPYSLDEFGNTSSASIPLTIVARLHEKMEKEGLKIMAVAFGVGLAWGSVYFETNSIVCPEIILM
jgi:3-oxoacyl-[acyl-carrier-protein] synthase-3